MERTKGFNVEVMSMLPPPSTARLCKANRRALSVCDWSAAGRAAGTEVIWIVPVSWAYEYKINSVVPRWESGSKSCARVDVVCILWADSRVHLTLWEVGGWYGYENVETGMHRQHSRHQ